MAFIRPQVQALVWRWRDVLAAAAVGALGLWWALDSFGVLRWLGWALVLVALALGFAALQRLRFARGGGGAGVVQVDEGRIAYFGPLTGGVIDRDDLVALDIDPTGQAGPVWILTGQTAAIVAIPVTAEGADGLFDLFASLPGLRAADLIIALEHPPASRARLWQRNRPRLH